MSAVTLYDVLGVRPSSTAAEIRAAYLAAARRAHPDVAGPAGDDVMRDLNSAWAVLGDARSREMYDLTLSAGPAAPGAGAGRPPKPAVDINRPVDRPFVPYHAVDEDDDDEWRYVDDETDPDTAPGAAVQLAPIALVAAGLLVLVAGTVLRALPVMALGGILLALGLVGFLIVPLAVMAKASTVEQRRDRERGQRR